MKYEQAWVKKGREKKNENLGSPQGCGRGKENPAKVLEEGIFSKKVKGAEQMNKEHYDEKRGDYGYTV